MNYYRNDEEGTEAVAVTVVGCMTTCMPRSPIDFKLNQPFCYIIKHYPTNTILFTGMYIMQLIRLTKKLKNNLLSKYIIIIY